MKTDWGQLPRLKSAYDDQQNLLKSGAIKAGPLGNPTIPVPLPMVKTAPPPIVPFLKGVGRATQALGNLRMPSLGLPQIKVGLPKLPSFRSPTPTPTVTPTPTPMNPGIPTPQELQLMLEQGAKGTPLATLSAQVVRQASPSAMYQKDPFLATAVPFLHGALESSNMTSKTAIGAKNKFGWAATVPEYQPPNVETALSDLMSATVNGRNMEDEMKRNPAEAKARVSTSEGYQFYRDDPMKNLKKYLMKFAGPKTKDNPDAGETYVSNSVGPLNKYAELLDQIMKKRGGSFTRRF